METSRNAPASEELERGSSALYGQGASRYLAVEMEEWKQCNIMARDAIRSNLADDALAPLRRAIALRPDWPRGYENLCGALLCCGELSEASLEARDVLTEGLAHCRGIPNFERLQTKLDELTRDKQERDFSSALSAAGFQHANHTLEGPNIWVHYEEDIEIMKDEDRCIVSAVGVAQEDVDKFVAQHTLEHPGGMAFGLALVEWVAEQRRPKPGAMQTLAPEELVCLPKYLREAGMELISPLAIGCKASRMLTIYTWGVDVIPDSRAPKGAEDAQKVFDATGLSARKFGKLGMNRLSQMCGLDADVQVVFCEYSGTAAWLRDACCCIEKEDLTAVSVVCAHGQHRSVAAAEIMKMLYYPKAQVVHLTIHG